MIKKYLTLLIILIRVITYDTPMLVVANIKEQESTKILINNLLYRLTLIFISEIIIMHYN